MFRSGIKHMLAMERHRNFQEPRIPKERRRGRTRGERRSKKENIFKKKGREKKKRRRGTLETEESQRR